jgi:lipopolysaccharide/colanic/teichoic acid biosynthesis glycosyltransferase
MSLALKAGLDRACAAIGLLVCLPLLCGVALVVLLLLGRPVLFRQMRAGLRGVPFPLLKFRTMREGAGDDGARLTRFGRFLRSTSLDELPQLWNVLRGDMSLVGPRPLHLHYLPRYNSEQARRHDMKPGVTGLSQVNGRNALGWERRLALDVWYVDHWSLGLDFRILARTAATVLGRRGISGAGSPTMPEFEGGERPSATPGGLA